MNLADHAPLLKIWDGEPARIDLEDTIIKIHGYRKPGASFGHSGVR